MGVELLFPTGRGLSITWVNPRDVDSMGLAGYLAVVTSPWTGQHQTTGWLAAT